MKVKLYIENDLNRYDECCVEAEFFSAPHAGDYVVADWYSIIDAILKADKTEYYTYYLIGENGIKTLKLKRQRRSQRMNKLGRIFCLMV